MIIKLVNEEEADSRFPSIVLASISPEGRVTQDLFESEGRKAISDLVDACRRCVADCVATQFVAYDTATPDVKGSVVLGFSQRMQSHICYLRDSATSFDLEFGNAPWKGPYAMWFIWLETQPKDHSELALTRVEGMLEQGSGGEVAYLNDGAPACLGVCGWDNPIYCGLWVRHDLRNAILEAAVSIFKRHEIHFVGHKEIADLFEHNRIPNQGP